MTPPDSDEKYMFSTGTNNTYDSCSLSSNDEDSQGMTIFDDIASNRNKLLSNYSHENDNYSLLINSRNQDSRLTDKNSPSAKEKSKNNNFFLDHPNNINNQFNKGKYDENSNNNAEVEMNDSPGGRNFENYWEKVETTECVEELEETEEPSEFYLLLFIIVSFGYMLPWTALGSLIGYYKSKYSATFYVKLYCAYYLPGFPVALLQYQYDTLLDGTYGSQNMYLLRALVSYIVMAAILISLIFLESEFTLILLFSLIGKYKMRTYDATNL